MKTDIRAAVGAKFVEACRVLLPGLAAFALIGAGARAETVDEIIVQNIQARGGLEKLKAIRTLRTTVKFSDGSFRAEFRQENKRPGKEIGRASCRETVEVWRDAGSGEENKG